jgi:hypothetical protein
MENSCCDLRYLILLLRIFPQGNTKAVLDDAGEGPASVFLCSMDEPFNVWVRAEAEQWAGFYLGGLVHSFNDLTFKLFSNPLQYLF